MSVEFENLAAVLKRYGRASDELGVHRVRDASIAVRDRLAGMMAQTVTAADPSGLVQATVRLSGRVESVYISPHAMRQFDTAGLGTACVAAVRSAREDAAAALTDAMRDLSGTQPEPFSVDAHLAELRRLTEG
jgi:DNA-binding protein YbaB